MSTPEVQVDRLRVLMIEDSESDANLILDLLKGTGKAIVSERVETEAALSAALATGQWDVVLSDNSLPDFDVAEALRLIQQSGLDPPCIIVSGIIGEEVASSLMRAGARDYVLKSNLARLVPAIEREVREATERAERRKANEQQRVLAARFNAMIENSVDTVKLIDARGFILYASPAAETVYGRPVVELIGQSSVALVLPEDQEAARQRLVRVLVEPSKPLMATFRLKRPDGSIRWIEGTAHNLLSDPSVGAIVCNLRDVTERMEATDRLLASEAHSRRIIETTNEGIWQVDSETRTTFMNARMASMLGYTVKEAMARPVRSFVYPHDVQPEGGLKLAEMFGKGRAREVRYLHRDGSLVWTRTDSVPIYDAEGRLEGAFALVLDITGQHEAEGARVAAEAALKKSDLQLRQAQKMEAVGRLAGGVAHDFNNLLSVILSYSTMLLEDCAPDNPMRADLFEICQAGRRAADLTGQLLAFSHQRVMEPEIVDLNKVVIGMERMSSRILGEDIELLSLPALNLGKVRVDPGAIEQVIMNLVVNARDAMPAGGQLVLETQNVYLDETFAESHLGVVAGPHVMLAATDTGHGMEPAVRDRIFEPFFTTKEKGKGTGLGLSTVFGIVQQSSGTIWVYSEPGRGTTFKVYLPEADKGMTLRRARLNVAMASLQGSETVLLVEDEEQVRVVVRGVLRRYGYTVLDTGEPSDALALASAHEGDIALLLTDVVMPDMSGPELANRLRLQRPTLRVLCMSGYTDDAVVRHGLVDAGMAFMQKPIVPDTLARKIREVLAG